MMHGTNPRGWEALAGGHKMERSQSSKGDLVSKEEEELKMKGRGRGGEEKWKESGKVKRFRGMETSHCGFAVFH